MRKRLTQRQIAAIIRRNNHRFKKATAAQKRVLIAEDVIDRVTARQYTATEGTWVASGALEELEPDEQIQPALLAGAKCGCCALGAIFLSCSAVRNRLTAEQFEHADLADVVDGYEDDHNRLTRIFTPRQLRAIEEAFERGDGAFAGHNAKNFGRRFLAAKPRLLAIMRNIVANKGQFKPEAV